MTRALKIEKLTEIDKTSAQILRVISLHLGADEAAFVDYSLIAKSLNIDRDTVRCAFLNRRKTLQNNLMISFSLSREQAKEVLQKAGVDEKARGETLSPERLAALSDILWEYDGGTEPQNGKEG